MQDWFTRLRISTGYQRTIARAEGFGERSAGLLLEAIERSKRVSLDRFLMGLGIRQVGQHIAKVLAREFGSLTVSSTQMTRDLQVSAIGPEISSSLVSAFRSKQPPRDSRLAIAD